MKNEVGVGVFTWSGQERRSDRYGSFFLHTADYNQTVELEVETDYARLEQYRGSKVRLSCTVLESRESGHLGDLFLGIGPPDTPTATGTEVCLGVGTLQLMGNSFTGKHDITLVPDDGRTTFWIDPRLLYKLHDQTVSLFIEDAEGEECHPPPDLTPAEEGSRVTDGIIQIKHTGLRPLSSVKPAFQSLGDGLYTLSHEADPVYEIKLLEEE